MVFEEFVKEDFKAHAGADNSGTWVVENIGHRYGVRQSPASTPVPT